MPNSFQHPEDSSSIPEIKTPDFKPKIPEHLLKDTPENLRWLVEQMDLLNQKHEYTLKVILDVNRQQRITNGSVVRLKDAKYITDSEIKKLSNEQHELNEKFSEVWDHYQDVKLLRFFMKKSWAIIIALFVGASFIINAIGGVLKIFSEF